MTQILDTIEEPGDLRKLDAQELATLAREIRAFLVETVYRCVEES